MSNQQKPPRKHHYLPRFYLAGFASHSTLWVYEKGRLVRGSKPEAEGCQKDFYAFEENGIKNFKFEKWFADLEHTLAQVIRDVTSSKREPTEEERTRLALFMGTMYTRTPLGRRLSDEKFGPATSRVMKEVAADPDEFRKHYFSMDTDSPDPEIAEEVRQGILAGRSDALEELPEFKLESIIEVGESVAKVLLQMGWRFVYAPDSHQFITSDNPLVCEVSEPGSKEIHFRCGVNLPNAAVWFPLTQNICILMQKGLKPGLATAPGATIRGMNKRIMVAPTAASMPESNRRVSKERSTVTAARSPSRASTLGTREREFDSVAIPKIRR